MAQKPSISSTVPSRTILAAGDSAVYSASNREQVTGAVFIPDQAITGAASPASRSVKLVNKGNAGAGTTVVGTIDFTAGVNAAAEVEKPVTLSPTAANRILAEGDVLVWQSDPVGGTGLVDPGGRVEVNTSQVASVATPGQHIGIEGAKTAGYVGTRKLTHPDDAYSLLTGPDAPTGANGAE